MTCVLFLSGPVDAQTPPRPDAGQILRETVPEAPVPRPEENRLSVPHAVERPPSEGETDGVAVHVTRLRLTGNNNIDSDAVFAAIPELGEAVGRDCNLAQLNGLADRVTAYYRRQGYLVALAYVPVQTVDEGVITIAVLEGEIDRLSLSGSAARMGYSEETIQRFAEANLCGGATEGCAGQGVQQAPIERALGVVADLPGIAGTTGTLAPGGRAGTSSLDLDVSAGRRWVGSLSADNYGNRYVGRERLGAGLRLNNPTGGGDWLSIDMISSGRGLNYGVIDYNRPFGYAGGRIGVSYSASTYTLGAPFDQTNAHGNAQTFSAYTSYPVIRGNERNLTAYARYRISWLEDRVADSVAKKTDQALPLGISGSFFDRFGKGAFTSYDVSATTGQLSQDGAANIGGSNAASNFGKFNFAVNRDQTLAYFRADRLSVYGALSGQFAQNNLASIEKFYLGGPSGVRAYPVGEAPGDSGHIATLELRYSKPLALPGVGQSDLGFALFRDTGWLTVNKNVWAGYSGPNQRHLSGYGVSVSLHQRDRFLLKLIWAARDRGSERATSDDDSASRLWLLANVSF